MLTQVKGDVPNFNDTWLIRLGSTVYCNTSPTNRDLREWNLTGWQATQTSGSDQILSKGSREMTLIYSNWFLPFSARRFGIPKSWVGLNHVSGLWLRFWHAYSRWVVTYSVTSRTGWTLPQIFFIKKCRFHANWKYWSDSCLWQVAQIFFKEHLRKKRALST